MRVLGVDPGSRITGYGVVQFESGVDLAHVASGAIKVSGQDLADRLKCICDAITDVIEAHSPDVVAVEQVFMARNARAALVLGHARGAAICAAVNLGVSVVEYSALQVKQAVVGNGRAEKIQVQHMIRALLGLRQRPQADAADALACAICHIHTAQSERRYRNEDNPLTSGEHDRASTR